MRISTLISIFSLLLSGVVLFLYFDLHDQLRKGQVKQEVTLIDTMHKFQLYNDKLYFAGKGKNWELAQFYHHELEEQVKGLEEAEIREYGQDMSRLVGQMTKPGMDQIKQAVERKDSVLFDSGYHLLVSGCNSCHNVSQHPFIKIASPGTPVFSNQDYLLD